MSNTPKSQPYRDSLGLFLLCFCHFNIRISDLFRISIFVFRALHRISRRNGRAFPGPPLEVVGLDHN